MCNQTQKTKKDVWGLWDPKPVRVCGTPQKKNFFSMKHISHRLELDSDTMGPTDQSDLDECKNSRNPKVKPILYGN